MSSNKERLMGLVHGHTHDNRERLRSINIHTYFIKEDFKEDLKPDVLDHLELIKLNVERLSKELDLRNEALRDILNKCLDGDAFVGDKEEMIKIINNYSSEVDETKKSYDTKISQIEIIKRIGKG